MTSKVLKQIVKRKSKGIKMLAILLDPDKISLHDVPSNVLAINKKDVDFIFIGGSTVSNGITGPFVKEVKKHTSIPIVLFPGNYKQLTNNADALLFLSLLSGRNPEYLIEQQIKSVEFLKKTSLEIIPTGYINGWECNDESKI